MSQKFPVHSYATHTHTRARSSSLSFYSFYLILVRLDFSLDFILSYLFIYVSPVVSIRNHILWRRTTFRTFQTMHTTVCALYYTIFLWVMKTWNVIEFMCVWECACLIVCVIVCISSIQLNTQQYPHFSHSHLHGNGHTHHHNR